MNPRRPPSLPRSLGARLGIVLGCVVGPGALRVQADPPAMGEPAMAEPAMGEAGMAEPGMGEPAAPGLQALTDAEAAPLLEGLKKAAKARNGIEALPALDSLAGKTHKEFEPALSKLLGHLSVDVAVRAAQLIGERANDKTAATLWRGWSLAINDKRPSVKGAILRAFGKMGVRLDGKQYTEIEKIWNLSEDPAGRNGIAEYFAAIKDDKRPCKLLAAWIDRPQPSGDINDGNNPPAAWWEARFKLWRETQATTVQALRAITGQTFATTEDAKKWFNANPAFGVKW